MRQEVPHAANRTVYRMAVFTGFATYQCAVVIFIEPCAPVRASILPFCLLISSYNFYTRVYKYVRPPVIRPFRLRRKRVDLFVLVTLPVRKQRRTFRPRAFARNTCFGSLFPAGGLCLPFFAAYREEAVDHQRTSPRNIHRGDRISKKDYQTTRAISSTINTVKLPSRIQSQHRFNSSALNLRDPSCLRFLQNARNQVAHKSRRCKKRSPSASFHRGADRSRHYP